MGNERLTAILSIFDRTMRYLLVDLKLGYVLWGMGCGMLLSRDVPWQVTTSALVGGVAGMIYCLIAERRS